VREREEAMEGRVKEDGSGWMGRLLFLGKELNRASAHGLELMCQCKEELLK
jgi:hypothetical protein